MKPGCTRATRSWRVSSRMLLAVFWLVAALSGSGATVLAQPAPQAAPVSVDTASYDLDARWDAATNQIHGSATITYRNGSPDSLGELWLKLYLNAFHDQNTLWMRESSGEHRGSDYDPSQPGWIRLERLALIDTGEDVLPSSIDPTATVLQVPLPAARAVGPGETVRLAVAWTSQLPRVFARTGVAGRFVMAGQWYPKLAVYDRGAWDTEPWHANAEFFADFGSYTLDLTVPSSYATGATGTRQATVSNGDGTVTVRYWANSVSDVAWTAWPEYRLATRVVEAAGHLVELELLAPRTMSDGADARFFDTAEATLDLLGRWFGPYPWPKLTLVVPPANASGAGGMEYPMLVTLAQPIPMPFGLDRGIRGVEVVTAHEIAHQWAPMQLASNEGREAWLDEGFADYATTRVLATIYPPDRSLLDLGPAKMSYEAVQRAQYLAAAVGQPLTRSSWEYDGFLQYGATVYSKGTMTFLTLERLYGAERFLTALRQHFDRWRWRHPTTQDLQASLESGLGTDLDWFFRPIVFGTGTVEYRTADVSPSDAEVERRGDVAFPVQIGIRSADGTTRSERWDAATTSTDVEAGLSPISRVQVDPDDVIRIEANVLDNGRDVSASPAPLLTLAARWLALVQSGLIASLPG